MNYLTNGKLWEEVQDEFPVSEGDLIFCFMKCGGYRGGKAEDQDWLLVESFTVVIMLPMEDSK